MKPALPTFITLRRGGIALIAVCLLGALGFGGGVVQAQEIADQERELLISTLQKQVADLQQELANERKGENIPLEQALAAANKEAEKYQELYRDLLLRVESLGLETIQSDKALQDRLSKAVRERQIYKDRYEQALEQMFKLSEAVVTYLPTATSKNPELRGALEMELRNVEAELGTGMAKKTAKPVDLNQGRVVSYKDDYGLAVLNVGSLSGVRIGMPVNIFRKDRLVGYALVVNVKDTISGAIVQEIFGEGDRVKVQDQVKPRTTSSVDL